MLLGGYYALIACGLSFMFGVMRVINLAHGSLAVLAAYLFWTVADDADISPFLGLVIVLPVMALAGFMLQRRCWNAACDPVMLVPLLSTFGLAIVLDNLMFETFRRGYRVAGAEYRRPRLR